ncbi:phosphatidylinositol N-acetylglucosaminyltransferase subunit C [Peziza echinospora]|nr:phosphatidylinositol N-acetylglucosaminyltransferase subunit C [Peziza echinospora]
MSSVASGPTVLDSTNILLTPPASAPQLSLGGHRATAHSHPRRDSSRARSTRRKPWRKLLWVKQAYPDNWVDSTFLSQLQRNINVHPYDFWPLVAESTAITQHLSSVIIFAMCFIAIFTNEASPVTVAGGGSVLTVIGYLLWDMGWEVREMETTRRGRTEEARYPVSETSTPSHSPPPRRENVSRQPSPLGIKLYPAASPSPEPSEAPYLKIPTEVSRSPSRSRSRGAPSICAPIPRYRHALSMENTISRPSSLTQQSQPSKRGLTPAKSTESLRNSQLGKLSMSSPDYNNKSSSTAPQDNKPSETLPDGMHIVDGAQAYRIEQQRLRRLRTAKSAILIYFTLLGLAPILRSLTKSISSDSIWAMASWLFVANCLSFDYGSDVSVTFPASLSTNAAIMASVVLASRLPTTTHVFSLVLFSIEMFGLFPVFRSLISL